MICLGSWTKTLEDDFQACLLMTCIPTLEKDLYFQNHDSYVSHGQTIAQRLPINMSLNGCLATRPDIKSKNFITMAVSVLFMRLILPAPFFSRKHLWSLQPCASFGPLPLCCVMWSLTKAPSRLETCSTSVSCMWSTTFNPEGKVC